MLTEIFPLWPKSFSDDTLLVFLSGVGRSTSPVIKQKWKCNKPGGQNCHTVFKSPSKQQAFFRMLRGSKHRLAPEQ